MRISDWSSDVCSSDLDLAHLSIEIEAARHAALFAEREQLARQPRRPPEIDEPDMIARIAERFDPERRARRANRTLNLCGDLDDHRLSGLRLIEPFARERRNQHRWTMEHKRAADSQHPTRQTPGKAR